MRVVTLAAVALLAFAGESAIAMSLFGSQSCNKGVLWPYVRSPGDCLTDSEIAAGQRGVYNGPVQSNPDIGALAPPPPAQPSGPTGAVPAVTANAPQPVPMVATAPAPVQTPVAAAPGMQTVTEFSCSKGLLWPFRRSAGDCLTTSEKRNGQTGVYGGGTGMVVTQVPSSAQQVIYQQIPQAQPGQQVIYQQVPQAQPGQQVIYQQVPQAQPGQVVVVQAAPPPQQAAAAATCTKGALWPFVKKPGDCESSTLRRKK